MAHGTKPGDLGLTGPHWTPNPGVHRLGLYHAGGPKNPVRQTEPHWTPYPWGLWTQHLLHRQALGPRSGNLDPTLAPNPGAHQSSTHRVSMHKDQSTQVQLKLFPIPLWFTEVTHTIQVVLGPGPGDPGSASPLPHSWGSQITAPFSMYILFRCQNRDPFSLFL